MAYDGEHFESEDVKFLRRVRHELVTRGWARHNCVNVHGNVCLIGAMGFARGIQPVPLEPLEIVRWNEHVHGGGLSQDAKLLGFANYREAYHFNDSRLGVESVLRLIDAHIERLLIPA